MQAKGSRFRVSERMRLILPMRSDSPPRSLSGSSDATSPGNLGNQSNRSMLKIQASTRRQHVREFTLLFVANTLVNLSTFAVFALSPRFLSIESFAALSLASSSCQILNAVLDLVAGKTLRLYPVGRLDADSSGLILLTNDGELANRLTHPSFQVSKTYRATLAGGPVSAGALEMLRGGVELEDGRTAPAVVRPAPGARRSESVIELTISEGRNRQVRRMCAAVGHPVAALQRIAFGPLLLGDLEAGAHRQLSAAEIGRLRAL